MRLKLAALCFAVATCISAYLLTLSLSGGVPIGCGPDSNCNEVLSSRWAYWLGLPVSSLALVSYLTLWGLGWRALQARLLWFDSASTSPSETGSRAASAPPGRASNKPTAATEDRRERRKAARQPDKQGQAKPQSSGSEGQSRTPSTSSVTPREASLIFGGLVLLAWSILLAAMWFTAAQLVIVRKICPYCMAAHLAGSLGAVLLLLETRSGRLRTAGTGVQGWTWPAFAVAVVGAAVLIAGQSLYTPSGVRSKDSVKLDSAASMKDTTAGRRILNLHQGKFEIDLSTVPILGEKAATNLIVSLFDYTCHHCRESHEILKQALEEYRGRLAIVSLPMPLDSTCNRLVTRTPAAHTNACQYAKISLAVWLADTTRWPEFDRWVFAPATPLPLPQVRAQAESLVGNEAFNRAFGDERIETLIKLSTSLYRSHYEKLKRGQMPQLVVADQVSFGPFRRFPDLQAHLLKYLPGLSGDAAK